MIRRAFSVTYHPAFYAVLGAIALQDPAAAYQTAPAGSTILASAQAVLRISCGFGLFALAVIELCKRARP